VSRVRKVWGICVLVLLGCCPAAFASTPSVYVGSSLAVEQYAAGSTGALTADTPPSLSLSPSTPEGIALSANGKFAYVTVANSSSPVVAEYAVGPDGTLTPLSTPTVATGSGPASIVLSPDGTSAYVTSSSLGVGEVSQYTVGSNGELTPMSTPTVAAGGTPVGIVVSPDGQSVYVVDEAGSIFQYSIGTGGALTEVTANTVSVTSNSNYIAVSPDGTNGYAYVISNSGVVSQFTIGTDDSLTPMSTPTFTASGSSAIAVTPDGTTVYIVEKMLGDIVPFTIGSNGELTAGTPTVTLKGISALAVSADGKSAYAATNMGGGEVLQFSVGVGDSLTADTPATVPGGSTPTSIAATPLSALVAVPTVTAGATSSVTGTAATLAGSVIPNYASTTYHFEYGTSLTFGSTTTPTVAGSDAGTYPVTAPLVGLTAGTTYYYRLVATNSQGTAAGVVQSFTTSGAAAINATPSQTASTNGNVEAITQSGGYAFLGGQFSRAGTPTGGGADLSQTDGSPNLAFAQPNGPVLAVVPDGSGGWYIGGRFTSVGNQPREGLAHLLPNGSVDPNFVPDVGAAPSNIYPLVDALALSGSTLYAGGAFTSDGLNNLAGFNTSTGATTFDPDVSGQVDSLLVDGTTLYVGGEFTTVGSSPAVQRNLVAAFDTGSGQLTSFDPEVTGSGSPSVRALAISGTTLYASGHFATVNGSTARADLAAFDIGTGTATAFNPTTQASSTIGALAVAAGTVYAGGNFGTVNGATANFLAAFDATSGVATTPFDADPDDQVNAITVLGGVVYAGGNFGTVNVDGTTAVREHLAAFSASNGTVIAGFNPDTDDDVNAIAVSGNSIYAGGQFSFVGAGTVVSNIAELNPDGTLNTSFEPVLDNRVSAIVVSGTTAYVAGSFDFDDNPIRRYLAAFNTTTGARILTFDPILNTPPTSLVLSPDGHTLYVGSSAGLSAVDATTGASDTAFQPNVTGGSVDALALSPDGTTLYAGGEFTTVNGSTARDGLASFNAATGAVNTAFNPTVGSNPADGVSTLALSGTTLYAGGSFSGTSTPQYLAGFDSTSGATRTAFDPDPSGQVLALALAGNTVYATGDFTSVNAGVTNEGLAAFDSTTGTAEPTFDPGAIDFPAEALSISQGMLALGGAFTTVGGTFAPGLAEFSTGTATQITAGASSSVAVGGAISATANLTGGSSPTGTITFNVYGPGDTTCQSSLAQSTATVSGDGSYKSASFTPTTAGVYTWVASYGGDNANLPARATSCSSAGAQVTVTPAPNTGTGTTTTPPPANTTTTTTTTTTTPTPTPTQGNPSISSLKVSGQVAAVALKCAGSKSCKLTLKLNITETLKHGKVVSVSASNSGKAKKGTTRRTVTVATESVTVQAGHSKRVNLKLNAAGRRVLAQLHALPAKFTETQAGFTKSTRVVRFKAPARDKK
jgi:6-phosphogluconolactonase (cycloisomerase 2 family)